MKALATTLLLFIFGIADAQPKDGRWPDIVPLETSVYFADVSKAAAWFHILDRGGKSVYLLQCFNWQSARDSDFDYSGDFECRLTSLHSREVYSTLLTDDVRQSRDWQSRGRVLGDELVGKCGDYPEYGRVRHFRLRKMKITFRFDEVTFKAFHDPNRPHVKKQEFQSLRFGLRADPEPSALSAIAETPPFLPPARANPQASDDFSLNCDVVRKSK